MVYPADLPNERDTEAGSIGDVPKENAEKGATKKKRGTLASAHSLHHHHHHGSSNHSNASNQLQLPGGVLARDNTSICQNADAKIEEERAKCCCFVTMSLKLAVYLAAGTGLVLNLIGLLFYLIQAQYLYGLPSLLSVVLYLSAMFAQFNQRASLFLPFLVINGLILFLWTCLCAYLLVLLILLPEWCLQLITEYYEWEELDQLLGTPEGHERARNKVRLFISISLGFTLVYMAIESWLWWIIFRGYRAARDQKAEEWLENLNKNIRSISIY